MINQQINISNEMKIGNIYISLFLINKSLDNIPISHSKSYVLPAFFFLISSNDLCMRGISALQ